MRKSFCICNNCRTEYEAGAPGTINVPHAVAARAARGESVLLCAKCVAAMRVNSTSARRWQVEAAFGLGATVGVQTSGGWYMYQTTAEGRVETWAQSMSPAFEGCNAYSDSETVSTVELPCGTRYAVSMPDVLACALSDQAYAWSQARHQLGKPVEF